MSLTARRRTDPPIRVRRADRRVWLAAVLLMGLLTASTVVSASALQRLPVVWQHVIATARGPRLPEREPSDAFDGTDRLIERPEASHELQEPLSPISTLRPEDYTEDWLQAGTGPDRLGTVRRSHQVIVGPEGGLRGRLLNPDSSVSPDAMADVRVLILREGQLAATSRTDEEGGFEVRGLRTGTHAVLVGTDHLLLAFGLHVLVQEDAPEDPTEILLNSPVIMGETAAAAQRRMAALPGPSGETIGSEPSAAELPAEIRPVRQSGVPGTPLWTHRVRQQPSGTLIGRVRLLHPQSGRPLLPPRTDVALLQDGKVVTTGRTDDLGVFATGVVEPGLYAVLATTIHERPLDERLVDAGDRTTESVGLNHDRRHRSGFAAFVIEVMPAVSLVSGESTGRQARNVSPAEPLELDFALIDALDLQTLAHQVSSGRERTLTGNAATSSGTRTAPRGAVGSRHPVNNPTPPGGGGGGGRIPFSFLPPSDGGGNGPPLPPDAGGAAPLSPAIL